MRKGGLAFMLKVQGLRGSVRLREGTDRVRKRIGSLGAALGVLALTLPGYCDVDVNASTQKVMKAIFNMLLFGGIAMTAVGIGMLVKTVISMSQGDQAQPGALGRAVAFTLGGIVLAAMKTIITTVTGQDPTTITIF